MQTDGQRTTEGGMGEAGPVPVEQKSLSLLMLLYINACKLTLDSDAFVYINIKKKLVIVVVTAFKATSVHTKYSKICLFVVRSLIALTSTVGGIGQCLQPDSLLVCIYQGCDL